MPMTQSEIDARRARCTEAVDCLDDDGIRAVLIQIVTHVEAGDASLDEPARIIAWVRDALNDSALTFNSCPTCQTRTTTGAECEECRDKETG